MSEQSPPTDEEVPDGETETVSDGITLPIEMIEELGLPLPSNLGEQADEGIDTVYFETLDEAEKQRAYNDCFYLMCTFKENMVEHEQLEEWEGLIEYYKDEREYYKTQLEKSEERRRELVEAIETLRAVTAREPGPRHDLYDGNQ